MSWNSVNPIKEEILSRGAVVDKRNTSIRDIAQETGLSVATISRVMNGSDRVSEETREKVLKACERLNYIPNPAARALSTKSYRTIAAIVPTLEHSIFARFLTAVEAELSRHGYSLVVASHGGDPEEELRVARKLLGLGVEAFVLSGADRHPALLSLLEQRSVPCVFTSVFDATADRATIGYDNFQLAALAVRALGEKGHSHIAVFHGPERESDRSRIRLEGALSAQSSGLTVSSFETEISTPGGAEATKAFLSEENGATAILCFSDIIALGAIFELQRSGKRVPEDISVMGFDNLDWSAHCVPPLTTINLPVDEMGRRASRALIDFIKEGTEPAPLKLKADLVWRDSVKRRAEQM